MTTLPPRQPTGLERTASAERTASGREYTRRILVVDDHRTFAELLTLALESQPDLTCVGHAQNTDEAFRQVREVQPDLVIMDLQLGHEDGVAATRQLVHEHPGLAVVVLTAHADTRHLARAAAAGACAFVSKTGALEEILATVRAARPGQLLLDPDLLSALAAPGNRTEGGAVVGTNDDGPAPARTAPVIEVTPRERQVLELLGQGLDARVIARTLGISLHTSRGHVKSLLAKLHAHSQLEAVVNATRAGLLPDPRTRTEHR
jgi:DNA-binding NarL/FixJ family response regulator